MPAWLGLVVSIRRATLRVAIASLLLFAFLIGYLTYFQVTQAQNLVASSLNPRPWLREAQMGRGGIFDRRGEPLALSKKANDSYVRVYPLGASASTLIGYHDRRLGNAGLEERLDDVLSGSLPTIGLVNWVRRVGGHPASGADVYLTIDARLQQAAWSLLGGRKGAVVALDPKTGAVLALVSSPSFDPAHISPGASFINRAIQGEYPPGSLFKLVVGAATDDNPSMREITVNCPGYAVVGGRKIACSREHGQVDFARAIAESCNTYFIYLAERLGMERISAQAQKMRIGQRIPLELNVSPGRFDPQPSALPDLAIGQGPIAVTPLAMAMVAAAVANDGVEVTPTLLSKIVAPGGAVMPTARLEPPVRVMSTSTARAIKAGMIQAVESGTAQTAKLDNIQVAAKTGTAEVGGSNPPHSWFVGFAPADNPRILVCVLVENGGYGGQVAGPIAREIMRLALT
ncbi:MAG: hypothetical protein H5U02_06850 [Clostridia bacterium]|nr:hypothetical protein [Clostridia bacterium]